MVELEPDAPLPFDDGAFDLVLCAETIEHVRDVQLLLSEVRRVLRPGGGPRAHDSGKSAAGPPSGPALTSPALLHPPLAAADPARARLRGRVAPTPFGHAARARYSLSAGSAAPDFSRSRARESRKSWEAAFECGSR